MTAAVLESIHFATPAWALAVVPVCVLLAWQFAGSRRRRAVPLTGLEYVRGSLTAAARRRRVLRLLLWGLLAAGLALLWAGPSLRTLEPVFLGGERSAHKHFVVALDMSPSMNLSMERGKRAFNGPSSRDEGPSRYEVARRALFDFLDRFGGERIGLVLFSTEPFVARWPTVETGQKFIEVLDEDIRRGGGSQLESFAGLTDIQAALDQAGDVFRRMEAVEGKAVILISDAEDEVENMGAAAKRLREQDIRLYTIGVGISERVVAALSGQFVGDPGFRIFHVDSRREMSQAYLLIGELEESPAFALSRNEFVLDLRSVLALALVVAASLVLWVLEARFHQSQSAGGAARGPRRAPRRRRGLPAA